MRGHFTRKFPSRFPSFDATTLQIHIRSLDRVFPGCIHHTGWNLLLHGLPWRTLAGYTVRGQRCADPWKIHPEMGSIDKDGRPVLDRKCSFEEVSGLGLR